MGRVGGVKNLTASLFRMQQFGLGKLIEFLAHGVGGKTELIGELSKIGLCVRVEEEPDEQLDAGL